MEFFVREYLNIFIDTDPAFHKFLDIYPAYVYQESVADKYRLCFYGPYDPILKFYDNEIQIFSAFSGI